jgi:hypothetical protein
MICLTWIKINLINKEWIKISKISKWRSSSLEKPKNGKEYVKTPAREEAFKKAREKRMSNIELRKKEQLLTEKN